MEREKEGEVKKLSKEPKVEECDATNAQW